MNSKSRVYLYGGLLGFGVGLLAAHLYGRSIQENVKEGEEKSLTVNDTIKLGMLILSIVRQVADFGATAGKKSDNK